MLKVVEVRIDISTPGQVAHDVETAAAHVPGGYKFIQAATTQSSVLLFYDAPAAPPPHSP